MNAAVARLEAEPPSIRHGRDHSRRLVTRDQLARAVARYYGEPASSGMLYRAKVGGTDVLLSMLTRPEWLDTAIPLGGEHEAVRYVPPGPVEATRA